MLDSLLGETTRRERPQVVDRVTGWLDAARPDGVATAQRAMAARPESFTILAGSSMPAVVVVGDEDTLSTVGDAEAMAAAFPEPVPVRVIPRSGHLSAVERPDAVTDVLRDVLRHF